MLSEEWRCSWSNTDRRCSNYIWVINNLTAYWCASYIRDVTVYIFLGPNELTYCPETFRSTPSDRYPVLRLRGSNGHVTGYNPKYKKSECESHPDASIEYHNSRSPQCDVHNQFTKVLNRCWCYQNCTKTVMWLRWVSHIYIRRPCGYWTHIHDLLRGIVTPPNMCSMPHIKHID